MVEEAQRYERLGLRTLPGQERDEQHHADREDQRDGDYAADGPPLVALAFDEPVHDREKRGSRDYDADHVEAVQPAGTNVRDDEECANERDDADRNVHEEDPAPVEVRDDEPTKGRAGDRGNADDRAPEAERGAHALAREDRGQDRERLRREQRTADALDDPGGDELTDILRETAERR